MPSISFIIPLYNQLPHTQAMLDSLLVSLPKGLDYEVLLVDDASTDGTQAWLHSIDDPRIRSLTNQRNQGYARANNRGIEAAQGEYLGLLNNDLLLMPGWFEPMFAILTDPLLNAGLVGNIQYRVADQTLDHAGVQLNLRGQFEHIQTFDEVKNYQKVNWVTGACLLLRRDTFRELGSFSEQYRNGCEDIDLCFNIRQARKNIFVSHQSRIQHHVSLSRGTVSLQNERNSQLLFQQWRRQIKHALAQQWTQALQTHTALAINEYLGGHLSSELRTTPHIAGLIIAESMLARQETRWAEILNI